ncbi:MAG: HAMP domain-containing protein [Deltaproteobacteria bacterium]|nr:HAMP domain-containing protein [Deltaproteobacteria bacterium]
MRSLAGKLRSFGTLRFVGRTQRRVVLAILVAAAVPLLAAMLLGGQIVWRLSAIAFQQEFSENLDRALSVYADLVKTMKTAMRYETDAIAAEPALRRAAAERDVPGLGRELDRALLAHPALLSLAVDGAGSERLAERRRPKPLDVHTERPFAVARPLGDAGGAPQLTAVFAADQSRLVEMEELQSFAQGYRPLVREHRKYVDRAYMLAFVVPFGLMVLLAVITGILVVRPVTARINRLAAATRPVAAGDLSVRVDDRGKDEIADLGRSFNQMLETLGRSQARVEFLKRVGEWQTMARRLAHEIKNPLTPIQLAVEECHRRYPGGDDGYAALLRTTLDIVVEEVGALRRLVGEFAELARLPRAELEPGDLASYLGEERARLLRAELGEGGEGPAVTLELAVEDEAMPVAFDREMLHRALSNLVANAAQAIRDRPEGGGGRIRLGACGAGDYWELDVDDDGPGIPTELLPRVFDPYVTTKKDGTGLGLTIVKKIVIDHGGQIEAEGSPLGGARFRLRLPRCGTSASAAALAQSEAAAPSARAPAAPL